MTDLATRVKEKGRELGFSLVGITPARPSPHIVAYLNWIKRGMHGSMGYLSREDRVLRRQNPQVILPGARTLIVAALDYATLTLPDTIANDPARGRISNYAWGLDYHDVMLPRLEALIDLVRVATDGPVAARAYVDTGAILERDHAEQAGLGFRGKNTMLIHPRRGSLFFLGEILTDAVLAYDPESVEMPGCGTCKRCLDACPTGAFPEPYVLDARKCISYLTIEHKAFIPRELRDRMGNWVYGCDVCQDVCPWQRFASPAPLADAFSPEALERAVPPLDTLLALSDESFNRMFDGSPVARIKREQLVRNACIAAGNSGLESLTIPLLGLLEDESALVRGHAAWALGSLCTGCEAIRERLPREDDDDVRQELEWAVSRMKREA